MPGFKTTLWMPGTRTMPRIALLLASLLLGLNLAQATTVYKYTDENGNTVFTDKPTKGAETLDVQPVPTIPAIPVPAKTQSPAKAGDFKYNKIVIVSPEDQKYFINSTQPIVVQVALSPTLRSQDKVQLLLNGAPKGGPISATTFTLENVDRGQYSASVNVLDKDGNVVGSSNSITFFVKRQSKLMPKPPKPKPTT